MKIFFINQISEIGKRWKEFTDTPNPVELYGELRNGRGIGESRYNSLTGKPTSQHNSPGYEKSSDDEVIIYRSTQNIDSNAKLN